MNIKGDETQDILKMDKSWWQYRAEILAQDLGREVNFIKLEDRIWLRRN